MFTHPQTDLAKCGFALKIDRVIAIKLNHTGASMVLPIETTVLHANLLTSATKRKNGRFLNNIQYKDTSYR